MIRATKKFTPKCYTVDESSLGTKVYILYSKYYTKSGESRNQGQVIYRLARPFQSLSSVLLSLK